MGTGLLTAAVAELIGTFVLVFIVISVTTTDRAPAGVAPIAVGLALAAAIFIRGLTTGATVNPARAPGPIIGGILAAVLYDNFVSRADAS